MGGREAPALSFRRDGAERYDGAASAILAPLRVALRDLPADRAGVRITGVALLRPLLAPEGAIGKVASVVPGPDCRAVRAILFDKTPSTNWALGWHQDRTIAVAERLDVDGFGPWTVKSELHHVSPPFDLLARMVTLRVHLDDVPETNAPLLIAPGSHLRGLVPVREIEDTVRQCGIRSCIAAAGDVWLYATAILHASGEARRPDHRRVLQVDYTADDLPGGLRWSEI